MNQGKTGKNTIQYAVGWIGGLVLAFSISGCSPSSYIFSKNGKSYLKDQGKKYELASINGRWWMVDNFALKLPGAVQYREKHGKKSLGLTYQWEQAANAAPKGWRLPTAEELSDLFLSYGKVSYSGALPMYRERFGPYQPDSTLATYQSLLKDSRLSLPHDRDERFMQWNENPDRKFRTLFWTGDTDGARVYAVYWNKSTGVHFSTYPKNFYGFCRYVKIEEESQQEQQANQKLKEKRSRQEQEALMNRFQFE